MEYKLNLKPMCVTNAYTTSLFMKTKENNLLAFDESCEDYTNLIKFTHSTNKQCHIDLSLLNKDDIPLIIYNRQLSGNQIIDIQIQNKHNRNLQSYSIEQSCTGKLAILITHKQMEFDNINAIADNFSIGLKHIDSWGDLYIHYIITGEKIIFDDMMTYFIDNARFSIVDVLHIENIRKLNLEYVSFLCENDIYYAFEIAKFILKQPPQMYHQYHYLFEIVDIMIHFKDMGGHVGL